MQFGLGVLTFILQTYFLNLLRGMETFFLGIYVKTVKFVYMQEFICGLDNTIRRNIMDFIPKMYSYGFSHSFWLLKALI